jgi:hypothetical protein
MRNPSAPQDICRRYGIDPDKHPAIFGVEGALTTLFLKHVDNQITSVDTLAFVWQDVIVDTKRSFLCPLTPHVMERFGQQRTALGKDLINAIMHLQGFTCVIRGHQQTDAMRIPLDNNFGLAPLWECKANFRDARAYQLEKDAVYTLDFTSSCYAPNAREFESSALVFYTATFDTCRIQNELIDVSTDITEDEQYDDIDEQKAGGVDLLCHEEDSSPAATAAATDAAMASSSQKAYATS